LNGELFLVNLRVVSQQLRQLKGKEKDKDKKGANFQVFLMVTIQV